MKSSVRFEFKGSLALKSSEGLANEVFTLKSTSQALPLKSSVRFEVKCSLADEVFNLKSMSQALPLNSSVTFEVKQALSLKSSVHLRSSRVKGSLMKRSI